MMHDRFMVNNWFVVDFLVDWLFNVNWLDDLFVDWNVFRFQMVMVDCVHIVRHMDHNMLAIKIKLKQLCNRYNYSYN